MHVRDGMAIRKSTNTPDMPKDMVFPGLGKEKIVQRSLATHAQTILSVTQGKNDVHGPVGAGEFQAAGGSKILEVAGLVNMAH